MQHLRVEKSLGAVALTESICAIFYAFTPCSLAGGINMFLHYSCVCACIPTIVSIEASFHQGLEV